MKNISPSEIQFLVTETIKQMKAIEENASRLEQERQESLRIEEEKHKDVIRKIVQEEMMKERERVKHFVRVLVQEESRKINGTWRMKGDLSPG
jgi:predicted solute-binding protein